MKKCSHYFSMAHKQEISENETKSNIFLRELLKMHLQTESLEKFFLTANSLISYNQKFYGCEEVDDLVRKGLKKYSVSSDSHQPLLQKLEELKIQNEILVNFIKSTII